VKVKFTHEAVLKGYSFLAGEVHSFPEDISDQIISHGVAFQICSSEKAVDQKAIQALKEAKNRNARNR
jgi:hypothetical protein